MPSDGLSVTRGSKKIATVVVAMAVLHYVLYGLTLNLQRETLTLFSVKGHTTLKELRRNVFAGELPSLLMLIIAPLIDLSGPLWRWAFVSLLVLICGYLVNTLLSSDPATVTDFGIVSGDDALLIHNYIFPTLLTLLSMVDTVVDGFILGLPRLWCLHAPSVGFGRALASGLALWFDEPIGGLLAQVYGLLFVVLCAAAIGAYLQPSDFIPPESASIIEPRRRQPKPSADPNSDHLTLGDRALSYRGVWRRVVRRCLRVPLMPWWIILATLSPALIAPAMYRIASTQQPIDPIITWGKPLGNMLSFYVAKTLVAERKHIGVLFTVFVCIAVVTIAIPEIADGHASPLLQVIMETLYCFFDNARLYVCFSVASSLGHGCATTLLAIQFALFTIGEIFFIEVTLFLSDWQSAGCSPNVDGSRLCEQDAYGAVTRNVCAIGLFAVTLLYLSGTLTRCFFVEEDDGWRDAGRVMKRARIVMVCFGIVATLTSVSFFIVVFA